MFTLQSGAESATSPRLPAYVYIYIRRYMCIYAMCIHTMYRICMCVYIYMCVCVCVSVCVCVCEREIYFKDLHRQFVAAGKSKICRQAKRLEPQERVDGRTV